MMIRDEHIKNPKTKLTNTGDFSWDGKSTPVWYTPPKKVYISGPIAGVKNRNFEAFKKAEEELKSQGFEVINPHTLSKELAEETNRKIEDITWVEFILHDLPYIKDCNAIYLLKNWKHSNGSMVEYYFAKGLGLEIWLEPEDKEFDSINKPKHYCSLGAKCKCGMEIECIQVTEKFNFNLGNAIKYIWRSKFKGNSEEDLKKAIWYLKREIKGGWK